MENKNIQKTTAAESSDIFAVAEDQDKKNAAIDYAAFVMQLARPLVHDDKTYTELSGLDLIRGTVTADGKIEWSAPTRI